MKKRFTIFMLFMLLCASLLSTVFVYAKYFQTNIVTDNLNLTIGNENTEPLISQVTLNYWTYDGEKNVLAHQETYPSFASNIQIWHEADASGTVDLDGDEETTDDQSTYTNVFKGTANFLGWSVTGLHCINKDNNHIKTYHAYTLVPLVEIQAQQGFFYTIAKSAGEEIEYTTTPVVNLYDVYDKNVITIKQHPDDPVNDELGYTLIGLAAWDSLKSLQNVQNGLEPESNTVIPAIMQYQHGTYVHGNILEENTDDLTPELKNLLKDMGTYNEIKHYRLTSVDDEIQFYFHPGRIYSSSFEGFNASISAPEYKDTEGVRHDIQNYLFVNQENPSQSNMFLGGVAPDANLTLYAADSTPIDGSVANRSDTGYVTDSSNEGINIACFTTGTLVTLADNSQIPVEKLNDDHILRVYDHENGCYTNTQALLINYNGTKIYKVAHLKFADNTKLEIINERGLFDLTLNKYVYITPNNCKDFIGHEFMKEQLNGYQSVKLIDAYPEYEYTGCYSVTSTYYINHFINGFLTVPGGYHWFVNYFEYGQNLKYDEAAKQRDIETYGLYTVEDFASYVPEELLFLFDVIYPAKYLKVVVGKGLAKFEDILTVIQEWIIYYNLSGKLEQMQTEMSN